jgi:E3 ubiquitin-protein ligase NRDP1
MDNAHERRWPPGLLTLETRQMNRRQYEQVSDKLDLFLNVD